MTYEAIDPGLFDGRLIFLRTTVFGPSRPQAVLLVEMSILPHKYAEEKISVDKVSMARLNVGCSTGC
jgi:hypothetical protein